MRVFERCSIFMFKNIFIPSFLEELHLSSIFATDKFLTIYFWLLKNVGGKNYVVILTQEPSGEYQIANSHGLRTGMYYQWYSYNMVLPQPRTGRLDEGILTTYKVLLTLLETCRSSTNYQDSYILPIGFTNHNFVSCYCNQLELSIPIYY